MIDPSGQTLPEPWDNDYGYDGYDGVPYPRCIICGDELPDATEDAVCSDCDPNDEDER